MTVKELIELNQMILDVAIEVRKDGGLLLDAIYVGNDVGTKPPYPTRVPIKPEYAGNPNNRHVNGIYKDATYIRKSVNAREDGYSYWETKWKRVPAKYLDLEVYSWSVWPAYRGIDNKYREGERITIVALPSGEKFFRPEPEKQGKPPEVDDNQMTIDDWFNELSEKT